MPGWLKRIRAFAKPAAVRRVVRFIRGRYDAAQTNDSNRRHWAAADGLAADASASPEVRRILRNRARYEVSNNSYLRGDNRTCCRAPSAGPSNPETASARPPVGSASN